MWLRTPRIVRWVRVLVFYNLESHGFLVRSFDMKIFGEGAILGCDFVGTVEELGSEGRRIAKGDVIAGLIWGGECRSHPITDLAITPIFNSTGRGDQGPRGVL